MKKIVFLFLLLIFALTGCYKQEDVNKDGVVDILDYSYIKLHVYGVQENPRCDVNGDGIVDQKDMDAVRDIIFDSND